MLHPQTVMVMYLGLFLAALGSWHRSKDYDQARMGFRTSVVFSFLTVIYGWSCFYHVRTSVTVVSFGTLHEFHHWPRYPGGTFRLQAADGRSLPLYFDSGAFDIPIDGAPVQVTYIPYFSLVTQVRDANGNLLHSEGDRTVFCLIVVAFGLFYLTTALWRGAPPPYRVPAVSPLPLEASYTEAPNR